MSTTHSGTSSINTSKDAQAQDNPARTEIETLAASLECGLDDVALAEALDKADELAGFRDRFLVPKKQRTGAFVDASKPSDLSLKVQERSEEEGRTGDDCIYLCGNSLGLQPKSTRAYVEQELRNWELNGVLGHHDGREERPWLWIDHFGRSEIGAIVGAADDTEVCIMNSLSVNLHLLMVSFYRPTQTRYKILLDHHAFPSDQYAVESQVRFHGFDPADSIITVAPEDGEGQVSSQLLLDAIEKHGDEIALVLFAGIQYYTGQFFDLEAITQAAHAHGAVAGFDLAHAVGNVPLRLHDWDVDFACWCHYKYLNGSPGTIGGAFVHSKHSKAGYDLPRFAGWWSNKESTRFNMDPQIDFADGAFGWMLSNPPVLPYAALLASLEIFAEAGMDALRAKSLLLTAYLELLLDTMLDDGVVTILTPRDPERRGCQLSLQFSVDMKDVHDALTRAGVVCDLRRPSAMRIAPVPLYNSFSEVHQFVQILADALVVARDE